MLKNIFGNFSFAPASKEVSKRIYLLSTVALVGLTGVAFRYYFIGLHLSAYADFFLAAVLSLVLLLHYKGYTRQLQIFIISGFNILFILTGIFEGSATGQFLYFFALIVVIPSLADFKNLLDPSLIFYYVLSIIAFAITIILQIFVSPLEAVSTAVAHELFINNLIVAFLITLIFSVTYAYSVHTHNQNLIREQASSTEARTQFFSTMGHELRTPLNGIIGAVEIISKEDVFGAQNKWFTIIQQCSNHMLNQVNEILDFNKIEAGKLDLNLNPVKVAQMIKNIEHMFRNQFEKKNLQFKTSVNGFLDHDFEELVVSADELRLTQIINNLLSNALKFTEQGFVELRVSLLSESDHDVNILLEVIDTGVGIADEHQARIFESYWQVTGSTRYSRGSGLGLPISVKLLELMDSKLKMTSALDKGTNFYFTLTLYKATITGAQPVDELLPADLSNRRILLVEDNPINMMVAKKVLKNLNASVESAINGKVALDILADDDKFDIVLLDLEMPVLDGYQTMIHLSEHNFKVPVLAFTASLVDHQMYHNLLKLGFKDVILKPFESTQLYSQIAKQLKRLS